MTQLILTNHIASISELKASPMGTLNSAGGETVAILNRNQPAFYAVPAEVYERLMEELENVEISRMVRERASQKSVKVTLDEL